MTRTAWFDAVGQAYADQFVWGGTGPVFARATGRAGETAVRAVRQIGPKVRVRIGGRLRIPDGLLADEVNEVKNTLYVPLTRQLRDYLALAQQTGRRFTLWLRGNARLSRPLQQEIESGNINPERIP